MPVPILDLYGFICSQQASDRKKKITISMIGALFSGSLTNLHISILSISILDPKQTQETIKWDRARHGAYT